jgi:hypothetical protein
MKQRADSSFLDRLDGYRSMYFVHWILQQYAIDKRRLQDFSVAEIIEKYDKEQVKK